MGKVKSAYMAATMDDMQAGSEAEAEYAERIRDERREDGISTDPRDSMTRAEVVEMELSSFTTEELQEEIIRRNDAEWQRLLNNLDENVKKLVESVNKYVEGLS